MGTYFLRDRLAVDGLAGAEFAGEQCSRGAVKLVLPLLLIEKPADRHHIRARHDLANREAVNGRLVDAERVSQLPLSPLAAVEFLPG